MAPSKTPPRKPPRKRNLAAKALGSPLFRPKIVAPVTPEAKKRKRFTRHPLDEVEPEGD